MIVMNEFHFTGTVGAAGRGRCRSWAESPQVVAMKARRWATTFRARVERTGRDVSLIDVRAPGPPRSSSIVDRLPDTVSVVRHVSPVVTAVSGRDRRGHA